MPALKLLVIGDIHYKGSVCKEEAASARKKEYGVEFLKRLHKKILAGSYGAVVFMGDVVDDGRAPGALDDLARIRTEADGFGKNCFFVRGNHDCPEKDFRKITRMQSNYCVAGGYLLYFFFDSYGPGDICRRKDADLLRFREAVEKHPAQKPVVFQHNPVFPPIEGDYPYNLLNAREVHDLYRECGVVLSVSGHYHKGVEKIINEGVGYYTVPAVCEDPFPWAEITVEGGKADVSIRRLKPPSGLWDNHCHSEFAYCAEDATVAAVCERAKLFSMRYAAFVEHAAQLYLPRKNYWAGDFYTRPEMIARCGGEKPGRMSDYKAKVIESGQGVARLGLEVEADKNGDLTLLEKDRQGVEIMLGAVHFLPEAGPGETLKLFMKANEALLRGGVDVIAHPFRFFCRKKLPAPVHLFKELAFMLKEFGAAAEVNFHTNEPPVEFFRICLEQGVKLSLGTDTHNLLQAGDFSKHLDFLRQLGVSPFEDREMFFVL